MNISRYFRKFNNDFYFRTVFSISVSIVINLAFIIYYGYLGIKFLDAFAIGISIYYLLLICFMLVTLIIETRIFKKDNTFKDLVRKKNYIILSIFIFILDLCLIAPIILMVTQPRQVKFGLIPAIAMATYCVYKIVFAIIRYRKSKKTMNPTAILLKEIDIIGAIVSILTLQHTLIMVNGGMNESMRTLSFITSLFFILLIILFSILSFIKNKKLFQTIHQND